MRMTNGPDTLEPIGRLKTGKREVLLLSSFDGIHFFGYELGDNKFHTYTFDQRCPGMDPHLDVPTLLSLSPREYSDVQS